ncbi:MAG: XdhC family protein [Myxococcota bacterium]
MKRSILQEVLRLRTAKVPFVLMTDLTSGEQTVFQRDTVDASSAWAATVRQVLREDRCHSPEDRTLFFQPFNPPLRMHVVGAVHIAQPLCRMAVDLGYEVTLIDPRTAFAREERFVGLRIVTEWPDDAIAELGIDSRTAVVTLTHDPKLDDPALSAALGSAAFYIGALGSRRTHAARRRRLAQEGFDEAALDRIHGPVGLAIGARSPAEIAVSICAQITEVLRKAS